MPATTRETPFRNLLRPLIFALCGSVALTGAALGGAALAPAHLAASAALALAGLVLGLASGLWAGPAWRNDARAALRPEASVHYGDHAPPAAFYDPLTGLPTRRRLAEHVAALQGRRETVVPPLALLHIDLDGFRDFNATYGHEIADKFLRHVADTLRSATGTDDLAVRSGADEFMLLLVGRRDVEEVLELSHSIRLLLSAQTTIDRHALQLSASIGVALEPGDTPVAELVAKAGNARAEAARLGRGRVSLYTSDLGDRLKQRRETTDELRLAIERDEIEPFFQPQVDALTGDLTGMEALVRWRHPERGILAPWQFLDLGAEAGLSEEIGAVMRRKSFRQLASWRASGLHVPRIGLNVAASDLRAAGFVDTLMFDIDRAGLAPADVAVELLESAMIEAGDDPVISVLDRLSASGFRVELDDFGTGHASISNLHRIHVDAIKIDRSFVLKLPERPEQQKLTGAMLSLATALGIDSIAEGVESEAERAMLVSMGCRKLQGFAIGRPMAAADATRWIGRRVAAGADALRPAARRRSG